MDPLSAKALEAEIERLHAVFVDWFAGRCPPCDEYFGEQVRAHLAADFLYIHPSGSVSHRDALLAGIKDGYGTNPGFEIAVEDVQVRFADSRSATVCYVEVQHGAVNAPAPDNWRLSTALFVIEDGRRVWKHVHETWLEPVR